MTLAQGGMGVVELVRRTEGRFARLYAIKRPHPELRHDPNLRAMFLDEGRVGGLIRHAHVVSVLDVGEDDQGPYLLMDYIEGISASALIQDAIARDRRLSLPLCLAIVAQAARGLHAAHELRGSDGGSLGLVHRDVSPQNIVIGYDGTVRVTDFGIAKVYGNANRTSTGILKGNVGYMSPEQLRFREPDRRSDLFSLGVVLYELLAGRRLYLADETNTAAVRILEEPAPDIGEIRNDVTPELTGLMFELLAKDPAMRPPDAQQVVQRLEAILSAFEAEAGPFDLAAYIVGEFGDRRAQVAEAIAVAEQQLSIVPAADVKAAPPRRRASLLVLIAVAAAIGVGLAVKNVRTTVAPVVGPSAGTWGGLWLGGWHSCASRGRDLRCWGKNNEGQLGDGGTINQAISRQVSGVSDIVSMAGGAFHSVAVRRDGAVFGWGRNEDGELDGIGVEGTLEARALSGFSDAVEVAAGEKFTCVRRATGRVTCFGSRLDVKGTLVRFPTADVPGIGDAVQIAAGGESSCALRRGGAVVCFGRNDNGQLGDGSTTSSDVPVVVSGITDAVQVAVGGRFACALRSGGGVMCWGDNDDGQLGVPSTLPIRAQPAPMPGLQDIAQVALMSSSGCALRRGGQVVCWGRGDWGNLGDGTASPSASRPDPRPVLGLTDATFLAAGGVHVCARLSAGQIVCWGDNANGQLGEGTLEQRSRPVSVAAPN